MRNPITIAIAVVVAIILIVSGRVLLSISEPPPPGTLGKIDWFDEINWMASILNIVLPVGILLVGIHVAVLANEADRQWQSLFFVACAVGSSAFVAISVWIFMDRMHGPEVDLWAHRIWWR